MVYRCGKANVWQSNWQEPILRLSDCEGAPFPWISMLLWCSKYPTRHGHCQLLSQLIQPLKQSRLISLGMRNVWLPSVAGSRCPPDIWSMLRVAHYVMHIHSVYYVDGLGPSGRPMDYHSEVSQKIVDPKSCARICFEWYLVLKLSYFEKHPSLKHMIMCAPLPPSGPSMARPRWWHFGTRRLLSKRDLYDPRSGKTKQDLIVHNGLRWFHNYLHWGRWFPPMFAMFMIPRSQVVQKSFGFLPQWYQDVVGKSGQISKG